MRFFNNVEGFRGDLHVQLRNDVPNPLGGARGARAGSTCSLSSVHGAVQRAGDTVFFADMRLALETIRPSKPSLGESKRGAANVDPVSDYLHSLRENEGDPVGELRDRVTCFPRVGLSQPGRRRLQLSRAHIVYCFDWPERLKAQDAPSPSRDAEEADTDRQCGGGAAGITPDGIVWEVGQRSALRAVAFHERQKLRCGFAVVREHRRVSMSRYELARFLR